MQGLGIASHNGATSAHGLEQTPTEHKGVSEIDMNTRKLKQGDEVLVWDMA